MELKIPFHEEDPIYWQNFREYVKDIHIELSKYNAIYNFDYDNYVETISFEHEEDYIRFMLEWA